MNGKEAVRYLRGLRTKDPKVDAGIKSVATFVESGIVFTLRDCSLIDMCAELGRRYREMCVVVTQVDPEDSEKVQIITRYKGSVFEAIGLCESAKRIWLK